MKYQALPKVRRAEPPGRVLNSIIAAQEFLGKHRYCANNNQQAAVRLLCS